MKNIVIINSHLHSGSRILYKSLSNHPMIQCCKRVGIRGGQYLSNLDLTAFYGAMHKSKSKKALYIDQILHSHLLSTRIDFKNILIISFVRRPEETLNEIVRVEGLKPIFALRYYQYRLNRIYQVSSKAANHIFITFESLLEKATLEKIKKFIGVDGPLEISNNEVVPKTNRVPKEYLKLAEERYEKYHWLLNKNSFNHARL